MSCCGGCCLAGACVWRLEMNVRFGCLCLALVTVSAPAFAAHWKVDYSKSKVGFTVNWSGQPFSGSFKSWRADINFDPADLAHSRAEVSIDTGSETSGD